MIEVFEAPRRETQEILGRRVCEAFVANGYKTASYVATAAEAAELASGMIPDGCSVGIPGTVTVREIGLMEKLKERGCALYYHWDPALAPEDRAARLAAENAADWFVTSSNAVTHDGMMVNIDGTGNRVACMAWGTGKILYIVGMNKVCRDLHSAVRRARDVATPPNAVRIGAKKPPCTKTGHCVDCNSPDRICRVLTIMERSPFGREAHVILVGESLGY